MTYRSLEYVCANTTTLCQFQADVHSVTSDTADVSDVSARAEIVLPLLDMTGTLKLCSAPPHFFKKQPLVAPSEIDCQPWTIAPLPNQKEGYLLYPNSEGEKINSSAFLDSYNIVITLVGIVLRGKVS